MINILQFLQFKAIHHHRLFFPPYHINKKSCQILLISFIFVGCSLNAFYNNNNNNYNVTQQHSRINDIFNGRSIKINYKNSQQRKKKIALQSQVLRINPPIKINSLFGIETFLYRQTHTNVTSYILLLQNKCKSKHWNKKLITLIYVPIVYCIFLCVCLFFSHVQNLLNFIYTFFFTFFSTISIYLQYMLLLLQVSSIQYTYFIQRY